MGEKILIVDDDPETVQFLNLILTRLGYQILVAREGVEALELAHEELPDLIVLDVMMPGLDGFEVARNLRRQPHTALIPILMFTAKTQVEDKLTGYDAGVDIYLTKPIHPVDLYANIKALLSQRRARAEALTKKGYVVGVLAAKGGLGVSTIALNLAVATFQCSQQGKVIAAEMRPGQGTWAEELNLSNASGLAVLLRQNPLEITSSAVEKQLVPTPFGVHLLLASSSSTDIECMSALAQYEVVLQELSTLAPLVVLDIGSNFHPAFNILVELCDEVVLIVEPHPIVVRRTQILIDELREQGFGGAKALTVVMVNHTRSSISLTVSQVEEMLKQPVALGFPPAAELAHLAATRLKPMVLLQPDGLVSKQFSALAEILAHHMPE